jgi:hypothetical protein
MTYHVQSFMAFKPHELGHDPNHGIICSMTPYCAHMCILGWQTKFILGFSFSMHEKINFHFLSVKIGFFCEGSTENTLQN